MDDVHVLRDQHKADIVILIVSDLDNNIGGMAYSILDPVNLYAEDEAFAVVTIDAAISNHSLAHEAGHLISARHDWYVDDADNSPYSYNHGYVNLNGQWRTIMAYNTQCNDNFFYCTRIPFWSNPDVMFNDEPTGVPVGETQPSDNHSTLMNSKYCVANYRNSSSGDSWGIVDISYH